MRKTILTTLLVAGLTIATTAHAQVLKLGVKGGINYTHIKYTNGELAHKDRSGFFVGPTLKLALPTLPIGFDISALYDEREFETGEEVQGEFNIKISPMKVKLKQVTIPVNLRFTFGNSKTLALYLFGGPQFGFNINDKDPLKDQARTWTYEDSNFSVNLGAGILLVNAVQVSFNYNIDCGKSGEMTVDDAYQTARKHESKANAWQLGAAIYF
ncbi:MAG: porin family protein [Prevotella sp.]|nr:porin family protein [Prevotella sp.]